MPAQKMHDDEVHTDAALVRRLLEGQFPQWARLPIRPVPSSGTDNALYRLGEDRVVRMPRIHWATGQIEKERRWLPVLAPQLPLAIPQPLVTGVPAEGYPWEWSVYRWLEGEFATVARLADPCQAAMDLAHFINCLQEIDTTGGPPAADHNIRGLPLAHRDADTRRAIADMGDMYDVGVLTAAWEVALQAPNWDRPPVWLHGDMLGGNLLVSVGQLSAVIDFAGLAVGDPACDLMIAWRLFEGESRQVFRQTLGVDNATWARGRGHALSQALIFIPYYLNTNPMGVDRARRAVEAVLADFGTGR
jgi:aminoglycoside phosphotransferase (APT) family kinase protein